MNAVTVVVLIIAVLVLLQPNSLVGRWLGQRRDARELLARVNGEWSNLIDASHPLYEGEAQKAEIIMISDFECTYCEASVPAVDSALFLGIRIAYLHAPAPNRTKAKRAAEISECLVETESFRIAYDAYLQSRA